MGLRRRRVLAAKAETTPGTFAAVAASDAQYHIVDPRFRLIPLLFERNVSQASLTRHPRRVSTAAMLEINVALEMAGHPTNETEVVTDHVEPEIGKYFRACGFERKTPLLLTIGAITGGPFEHGELITQAVSGATGTVIGDTFDGQTQLFMTEDSGSLTATDALTGGTSSATATPSTITAYTINAWQPVSTEPVDAGANNPITMSMSLFRDGKFIDGSGFRGSFRIPHAHGDRVLCEFAMRGVHNSDGDIAIITPNYAQLIPPDWVNIAARLQESADALVANLVLNSLTVDWNADVQVREDSNDPSGYTLARIIGRDPSVAVNPDEVLNTVYDFIDKFVNAKINNLEYAWGTVVGNQWKIRAPGLVAGTLDEADRDGVDTWDGTWHASGGLYSSGDVGADNELIIYNY